MSIAATACCSIRGSNNSNHGSRRQGLKQPGQQGVSSSSSSSNNNNICSSNSSSSHLLQLFLPHVTCISWCLQLHKENPGIRRTINPHMVNLHPTVIGSFCQPLCNLADRHHRRANLYAIGILPNLLSNPGERWIATPFMIQI